MMSDFAVAFPTFEIQEELHTIFDQLTVNHVCCGYSTDDTNNYQCCVCQLGR